MLAVTGKGNTETLIEGLELMKRSSAYYRLKALLEGRMYLAPIVDADLFSGATRSVHEQDNRHAIDPLPLCPAPREHWMRVGRLRMSLARKGLTVSTPDAHVAQCALDLQAQLLTRDRNFSRIARHCGLRLAG